jgi:hypothetical protein
LQPTGNHFSSHMRLVHGLVRQHGLAHHTSPMAKMWEMLVRIWMSTLMKPRQPSQH